MRSAQLGGAKGGREDLIKGFGIPLDESLDHIYHAAMMDTHTAAELDLRQIRALVKDLLAAHGNGLPGWAQVKKAA